MKATASAINIGRYLEQIFHLRKTMVLGVRQLSSQVTGELKWLQRRDEVNAKKKYDFDYDGTMGSSKNLLRPKCA
jgi:hypothetical protein